MTRRQPSEQRRRNLEQLKGYANGGRTGRWPRRLRRFPEHTLDGWAAIDASSEFETIYLARWKRPETRAAIRAARRAAAAAWAAMRDEMEARGI